MSLLETLKKIEIAILGVNNISDKPKDDWKRYRKNHWKNIAQRIMINFTQYQPPPSGVFCSKIFHIF